MAKKKTTKPAAKRVTKKTTATRARVKSSKKKSKSTTRAKATNPTTAAKSNGKLAKSSARKTKSSKSKRRRKSPLSRKELMQFRQLLLEKRAEIVGDIGAMSQEALRSENSNLSHMPIHMADVGSDNYEQELTLGLVESERRLVQDINAALQRIADGTYGICAATDKPINKTRLKAKPWAQYCIEAAREMERRRGY